MSGEYIGVLSTNDLLYDLLADEIVDRVLGFGVCRPVFDVYRLDSSSTVFRYADRRTFVNLVGKFYGNKWLHGRQTGETELRAMLMQREFDNLQRLRALGLDHYPHRVVRPLGVSVPINCVLVEDFASGPDLNFYIREATHYGKGDELRSRLTDVAWFLADMHNRSETNELVNDALALAYLDKVIGQLAYWDIISAHQRQRLACLRKRWAASRILGIGQQVLIHGDANPTNFRFSGEHGVTIIDLERLQPGDRAADLGCVVAELKHLFWWYSHDSWASEQYIQHLYATYTSYLHEGAEDFAALITRGRFYMGCYELHIGLNAWLDLGYRRRLIENAEECLMI